jgi:exosortase
MMSKSRAYWISLLLAVCYLWIQLVNSLTSEWRSDPQYSYGWIVPILSAGLLVRRWGAANRASIRADTNQANGFGRYLVHIAFAVLAALYLPTRLVEAAVPEWRPIQWAFGIETVGLTLCAIDLAKGRIWTRWLAFPICFFLISVPWPTSFERAIIQPLTRANSIVVVDLLSWLGVPAVPHGNVIEISSGSVGINEACSGIRSLQTSLMISLFFGEFYFMSGARRVLLISVGFILAMVSNVGRMSLLTLVAANKGIAAIAMYHDEVGISTTLFCALGLWGLAVLLNRSNNLAKGCRSSLEWRTHPAPESQPRLFNFTRLGFGLLLWLAFVDVGVHLWYFTLESHLAPSPKWSVAFPTDNPTFKTVPISPDTASVLAFDEGKQAEWAEADGSFWKVFYFSWQPGRVAGYLAKRHTPEACLPATGGNVLSDPKLTLLNVKNVVLPVRSYEFKTDGKLVYVFQCRWEAGTRPDSYIKNDSTRFGLIRGIWAGRGNKGQKVLELAAFGFDSPDSAAAALNIQLHKLVTIDSAN